MKNKLLIVALVSPLLQGACESKKVIEKKTSAAVGNIASPRPKTAEIKAQTSEEIIANTKKVMDQMNDQASSGRHGLEKEAEGADEAARAATRKLIEEAARSTTEATEKAMQDAAKNALEASETVDGTTAK